MPTDLRNTIGYILNHNIIYSKQYEKIEYGKAGDELEKLLNSEMGKFAEWIEESEWVYWQPANKWQNCNTSEQITITQLIELYKNRNKV